MTWRFSSGVSFLPYYAVQLWFIGGAAVGFLSVVSSIWRDPEAAP